MRMVADEDWSGLAYLYDYFITCTGVGTLNVKGGGKVAFAN